jgi:hypothetical protein
MIIVGIDARKERLREMWQRIDKIRENDPESSMLGIMREKIYKEQDELAQEIVLGKVDRKIDYGIGRKKIRV